MGRTTVVNDIPFVYAPSGPGYFTNLSKTGRKSFELGLDAERKRGRRVASNAV